MGKAQTVKEPQAPSKSRTAKVIPELSKAQQEALSKLETVSAKIRYLDGEGFTRSENAAILDKRYQHIRNVLITPVARQAS